MLHLRGQVSKISISHTKRPMTPVFGAFTEHNEYPDHRNFIEAERSAHTIIRQDV
jgi:hypothetical protein